MALGLSTNPTISENEPIPEFTRLHITPLNPTLLPSILPKAVLSLARNISYHSIQTFPEKDFGFVELPDMEAQKVKRRLNGSILKGMKIKIEEARPSKQVATVHEDSAINSKVKEQMVMKPLKNRKTDTETLLAVELQGRRVKRGWTDPTATKRFDKKEKKKKGGKDIVKSKYTSNPECLFRTTLPANIALPLNEGAGTADKKDRRKRRKKDKEVIVHEFSKTVRHATFLRSSGILPDTKGVTEYVEGQGWINDEGKVIEAAFARPKRIAAPIITAIEESQVVNNFKNSDESSMMEDISDYEVNNAGTGESEVHSKAFLQIAIHASAISDSESSSSGMSSSGSSDENYKVQNKTNVTKLINSSLEDGHQNKTDGTDTDSTLSTTPVKLKLDIPKTINGSENAPSVHPLEALYKRRRPDLQAPQLPNPIPSFTFFDADVNSDEDEVINHDIIYSEPMTPYTRRDLDLRGHRSAAPTPDTAYPSKGYEAWPRSNPSDKTDELGNVTPTHKGEVLKSDLEVEDKEVSVSDFQKWFYEHRGEANRAWKRRRKLVAKEKRQRENRKRNDRMV